MKRNIISINEDLCNGCGACVEGCHEGALQLIDGKARIVSELYCDGLGACIGECPVGAITIEKREAEPYDERAVMARISSQGEKTVLAHLKHLKEHNELVYLNQGLEYIKEHGLNINVSALTQAPMVKKEGGCPGSMARAFGASPNVTMGQASEGCSGKSELTHWPVQLHLLNPAAGYLTNQDLVLAADCTAFAYANFHSELLKGKKLAIACPKLDSNKEVYVDKLVSMIDNANINSITVVIMEVPCCAGLKQLVIMAAQRAKRKVPIKVIVVSVQGDIVSNSWL